MLAIDGSREYAPANHERQRKEGQRAQDAELRELVTPPVLRVVERQIAELRAVPVIGRDDAECAETDASQRILSRDLKRDRAIGSTAPERGQFGSGRVRQRSEERRVGKECRSR